ALNAQKYALVRPSIIESSKENFLQISGLRHLLVEAQGIAYVPNDIVMGDRDHLDLPYPDTVMLDSKVHDGANIRGVLLYGINSSGKSSLMKSIGIAVALAQAGFYVPAKAMKFSLFDGVYTRIQSRDNVAKSLSTFGVEMLELNTVFSRATSRSLILGDEISHGTETLSAVAIVASTIMELSQKGALFLMTTHLHQLSMISELSRLREVVNLHLSVHYNAENDRLIYDRILKPGRGSSVYGLEFAESLHMDPHFLQNAKRLRENLAKEYDVLELGNQKEYIKRYREVVASECVICGALVRNRQKSSAAKEHHHLIALCETHSRQIAQGKIKLKGFIMTPQGLRLEYETQLKEDLR
ncbi:MutS-related protein, partial [Sulfuricurvum sp.]|uniref:MutS-related protein n=1 Tax=Sulfuricurvum sp. TaxID=2025608 RepID=UPI003BB1BF8C